MNDSRDAERLCPICQHEYARSELTKHHLVPKSRKGKITVPLCRPCHRQIHALYTEKELEENFGTLESLLEAELLQPWIRWIRKRKPTAHIKTKTSKRKKK
ncbi:MAG: HNH endonuclease [Planctomycetaceae bacterium]|nr:HNH endonuclease [Planctomycetaceae bacterium]